MSVTSEENINFTITQGESFLRELQYVSEEEGTQVEIPIDITGYTFVLEVRDKPEGRFLAARCSIGDGITITDAANGIVTLSITPEKTNKFSLPRSAYQLNSIDPYGSVDTWLQGWFKVYPGVIY